LHWLKEPEATDYFRRAAEDRIGRVRRTEHARLVQDSENLLAIGNYYRLAGDQEQARYYLEWAYSELRKSLPGALSGSQDLLRFIDCGYLLGHYAEVEAADREKGSHRPMAKLARARLAGDARAAARVVAELAEQIREVRARPGSAGLALDYWDRYELALQAVEDLGGVGEQAGETDGPSPRRTPPNQRGRLTRERVLEMLEEASEQDEQADFSGANLSGADLSEIRAWQALFVDADLRGTMLAGSDLRECHFSGAVLREADLSRTWLEEADFSGADLSNADLRQADLSRAVLMRANLSGTNLSEAELVDTNLQEANLRAAILSKAEAQDSDFSEADLTGADLRGARLEGADLEDAILEDTLR
jgi:uncharacterized protein YjbI with pentapeptide repeats